jgi:hypothetical protein
VGFGDRAMRRVVFGRFRADRRPSR